MAKKRRASPAPLIKVKIPLTDPLLLVVTLILMFLFAELVFRYYYGVNGMVVGSDEYERCSRASFMKSADQNNIRRFIPANTVYLEYANHTGIWPKGRYPGLLKETIKLKDNVSAQKITPQIMTNNLHLRAVRDYTKEKRPGVLRIAVFGDSFTWGAIVPNKMTYPQIAEYLLNNSEVLNYGVEGTGIDTMYLRWKHEALAMNPDVVVFSIHIDDIRRAQPCLHKPTIRVENGKLQVTNKPPPTYQEIFSTYKVPLIESYFLKHLAYNLRYVGGVSRHQYVEGMEVLDVMLDEMASTSKRDGTYFMVYIIPAAAEQTNTGLELDVLRDLEQMLAGKNIPYENTEELFIREGYDPSKDPWSHKYDHFTPKGFAYVALGLLQKLASQDLVDVDTDIGFHWQENESTLYYGRDPKSMDRKRITTFNIIRDK